MTVPIVDRRTFLKRVGAGAGVVIASRLPAPGVALAQDATFKVDPAAKRGGTLRYGVHSGPVHFDVHQSGTVANIGPQGPMYDTLLRRDPRTARRSSPTSPSGGRSRPTARSTPSTCARASSSTTAPTSPRMT